MLLCPKWVKTAKPSECWWGEVDMVDEGSEMMMTFLYNKSEVSTLYIWET